MRLVVLGGSGSSTPELADALVSWPGGLERRPPLTIVLHGRSLEKLELVAAEFRARAGNAGPPLAVATAADRRRALDGADVVLNQVRVGGLDARAFDESFPWPLGLPGEETMGPGGFANALRTVPALAAAWDDVVALAPTAFVVNLTNPAGIVQQVVERGWPGLHVVSVCDAPLAFAQAVARRLGRSAERVIRRYVGMNHCGWYVPEGAGELDGLGDLVSGMDPGVMAAHGALPTPYVRYYAAPERQLAAQRGKGTRAQQLKQIDAALLAGYAAGPGGERAKRGAVWYGLAVLPLLDGWLHGAEEPLVLGVRNEGRLPEAPPGTMIEIGHRVSPGRLEALDPPDRPTIPSLLLARHGTYEKLACDALLGGGGRDALLRALVANPMVVSYDQAVGLLKVIDERSPRG